MFDRLPESTPVRQRSALQLAGALLIHAILLGCATALTRELVARPSDPPRDPAMMTYLAPTRTTLRAAGRPAGGQPGAGLVAPAAAALPPGPVIVAGLPPIAPAVGPGDERNRGWHPPARPSVDPPALVMARPGAPEVDEPVVPIDGPEPRYPPALRAAGVEGSVRLRFVVDSAGAVVGGSISSVNASHAAFLAPAVAAIRGWRFRPARLAGHAVAQQVEQVVRFRLDR